jgi:ribosome-binding factor A
MSRRRERVERLLTKKASEVILQELADPRMGFVTVTRAEISPDLREAKVFVSIIGDDVVVRKTFAGLEHAAGFVQHRLGDEVELKNTPRISFVLDDSVKKSVRISELLRQISEEKGGEPDQA